MDSKVIGSILLIVGTTLGAGMLALPIAMAQLGFLGSLVFLILCWLVMTSCAFLLLEVNLCLPPNSNLITMARETIGPVGQVMAWLSFLLLLYSLLSAYISGGSGLMQTLLAYSGIEIDAKLAALLFTLIFGLVVFYGVRVIDYTNRGLMFIKLGSYALLTVALMPHVDVERLYLADFSVLKTSTALMVTVTSFGFAIIVPSLRIYLSGNIQQLKRSILIGSLIPLFCYVVWDVVIMGVLPLVGEHGLLAIAKAPSATGALVTHLVDTVSTEAVSYLVKTFTAVCVLTSFLGVSLCLTDFLADGFKMEKVGFNKYLIQLMAFLPPLMIVLFYPNAFIQALAYAGIYAATLLILLPAWMAFAGRRKFARMPYQVPFGRGVMLLLIVVGAGIITYSVIF